MLGGYVVVEDSAVVGGMVRSTSIAVSERCP